VCSGDVSFQHPEVWLPSQGTHPSRRRHQSSLEADDSEE